MACRSARSPLAPASPRRPSTCTSPTRRSSLRAVSIAAFEELWDFLRRRQPAHEGDPRAQLRALGAGLCRVRPRAPGPLPDPVRDVRADDRQRAARGPPTRTRGSAALGLLVSATARCLEDGRDPEPVAQQLWIGVHGFVMLRLALPQLEWPNAEDFLADLLAAHLGRARGAQLPREVSRSAVDLGLVALATLLIPAPVPMHSRQMIHLEAVALPRPTSTPSPRPRRWGIGPSPRSACRTGSWPPRISRPRATASTTLPATRRDAALPSGRAGIRTRETARAAQRFSRPPHSTALPPFRGRKAGQVAGPAPPHRISPCGEVGRPVRSGPACSGPPRGARGGPGQRSRLQAEPPGEVAEWLKALAC